jgi:hypothetical protein
VGFYFKVAPGVRIRASSRGLRASVGPRAARVHFGAGRPGISTGAGPVTLYHSIGGSRRRSSGSPSRMSVTAQERQVRHAQKENDAQELMAAFEHIVTMHRREFPPASPPVAPPPEPVDAAVIRMSHEQEALKGLGVFQRSARAAARRRAAVEAEQQIGHEVARRQQAHAELQRQLNEQWQRLLANDPDVVRETLTEAFEDNEAFAAVAGVHGDEAAVVVLVPGADAVPDRMPRLTQAGNLSIPKIPKGERNAFYVLLVCGHLLATVRESLAVAPGLGSVRVAAVRLTEADAYGTQRVECLLATLFRREALHGVQWDSADAAKIVNDASAACSLRQGRTGELLPLDLSAEPALATLIQAIEVEHPDHGRPGLHAGDLLTEPPPPWRPRPGWGTIRDYKAVPNDQGGTDVTFRFVPDDGSDPILISSPDGAIPEAGECARGIMVSPGHLNIKVAAASMAAEHTIFEQINAMEPAKRAVMYEAGSDVYGDCGWAWTPDYKLVKAAPGLIESS